MVAVEDVTEEKGTADDGAGASGSGLVEPRVESVHRDAPGPTPSRKPKAQSPQLSVERDPVKALEKANSLRDTGKELFDKGDFADAAKSYESALVACALVPMDLARELRVSCHLNAGLSQFRRCNFRACIEHCTGAADLDSTNAKAVYRRGCAREELGKHPGHSAEVPLAVHDIQAAHDLAPDDVEISAHLKKLRSAIAAAEAKRKHVPKPDSQQRETYKNMFSSDKAIYEEKPKEPPPVHIRDIGGDELLQHELLISAEQVDFKYSSGDDYILDKFSLEARAGWCLGIVGRNASGKSTCARVMCGKLKPTSGLVVHHAGAAEGDGGGLASWLLVGAVLVACCAAVLGAAAYDQVPWMTPKEVKSWLQGLLLVALVLGGKVGIRKLISARVSPPRRRVMLISGEEQDKEQIDEKATVEKIIAQGLPRRMGAAEKRDKVIALMKISNFLMYDGDGSVRGSPEEYVMNNLRYDTLSGGQKHLVYLLRCFAMRPDVMICDEILCGLDATKQPRILRMLKRMKDEGAAVIFISTELHQLRLLCDRVAFFSGGHIAEHGTIDEVFDFPKHPELKEYLGVYRGLPGCWVIGGRLAEDYCNLTAEELDVDWLPPR